VTITDINVGARGLLRTEVSDPLLAMFEQLLVVRRFEERTEALRKENEIQGSVHLCIGQEATAVGACAALEVGDPVYATYRGHGWALASGVPLEGMFAELLGRESGVNGGRGGSAYLSYAPAGFMGENSIVGAGAPIAVGSALASRNFGDGRVTVSVFGDGATNQGAVHEALNMAAVFSLPVIFVCENNVYSELTPIEEMVAEPELYRRAAAYGMQASRVDGNDVSAMAAAVSDAAERCRRGGGPVFLEAMTYRLCGHYIGDAETYRTATEVSERSLIEPIKVTAQQLRARGVDEGELDKLDSSVRARVDAAADGALAAPLADTTTLFEHLYA